MPKSKTISEFLNNHLWQILSVLVAGIVGFTMLQSQIKMCIGRVEAVEETLAFYPSKAWFTLKFETMEESSQLRFDILEQKIDINTKKLENL